jgi:hypothetical protein
LDEQEASGVTREAATKVIVLAGPVGSGKTTILTSLFESFLEAPFANLRFAGSQTLIGFERRCYEGRTDSGLDNPDTVHTQTLVSEFLHLKLAAADDSLIGSQHLLLADVSGERFRALRDSSEAVRDMKALQRADHLCILLDGDKLGDAEQRHSVRSDARMLLRSILEQDVLPESCQIGIVFSKWDKVKERRASSEGLAFIEDTKDVLRKTADLRDLTFFEIAARPEGSLPFAFGLPTLLRFWVQETRSPEKVPLYMPRVISREREGIARFGASVVNEQRLTEVFDVQWV